MKKLLSTFLLTAALAAIAFMAIMPGTPKPDECGRFHPHVDELGGPEETLKILGYMSTNMPISVFTNGARTIVTANYQAKTIFMVYGTGNPTMFPTRRGIDYVREQTAGLKQVNSPDGIQRARDSINSCLKSSFESSLVTIPAPIPVPVSASPSSLLMFGGIIGLLIFVAIMIGRKKTANVY